jgi:phosphonate transport system ATP-binding protein
MIGDSMLKLGAVTKKFGSSTAVNAVDLEIGKGQIVGVIGRSGAGKSTLLRIINRLIDPSEGSIEFDGTLVSQLKGRDLRLWRARCAMIFQQFNLVNRLDVLTNVLIGRVATSATLPVLFKQFSATERTMAAKALDRLNLLPQALQRADTLSGGQQQRVAIARALVQMPDIVLADEPIASLDPHNARLVMDALKTINREDGITVICNLHTLDAARTYCDRIIGLAKGRVVFDGGPEDLTNSALQLIYGEDGAAPIDERLTAGQFERPKPELVWAEPMPIA